MDLESWLPFWGVRSLGGLILWVRRSWQFWLLDFGVILLIVSFPSLLFDFCGAADWINGRWITIVDWNFGGSEVLATSHVYYINSWWQDPSNWYLSSLPFWTGTSPLNSIATITPESRSQTITSRHGGLILGCDNRSGYRDGSEFNVTGDTWCKSGVTG